MLSIEQIRPELTWRLRHEVLYPHKKIYEMEMDVDAEGIHFGAFKDDVLVAVISLFRDGSDFKFGKFAVDSAYQKQGIGSEVLQYITGFATEEGGARLWCNARINVIDFYIKHGFVHTGNFVNRDGFDHEIIEKRLS